LTTARPPATSAIEIGTELILDPPNVRLSWLRALGQRTRRVRIQFAQGLVGRVSFEQAEQPSLQVDDGDVVLVGVRVDAANHAASVICHPSPSPSLRFGAAGRDGRTQQ